jgi:hypothetical protein
MNTITTQHQDFAPLALAPHKRRPAAGPSIAIPSFICFACFDTGIVANHDGAINEVLADFDVLPSGGALPGSDPAIICCCLAAYPAEGRGGYRDSAGVRRLETASGPRLVGCEISADAIASIHRRRRQIAFAGVQASVQQARHLQMSRSVVAGILPPLPQDL